MRTLIEQATVGIRLGFCLFGGAREGLRIMDGIQIIFAAFGLVYLRP